MNYRERINSIIPGGAHTYSRGDDQFPENVPHILSHGKGCYLWDSDDNKFLDYGMGLRAVSVGYANDEIDNAAIDEIKKGTHLTRPSLTELKAAELIVDLIPSAEMVKFAKNGSTVTTAAVKLARAYTRKKYVAMCAENAFISYDDWFIGSTDVKRGIPKEVYELTLKFHYNDIESVKSLFEKYPNQIACLIFEPVNNIPPKDNFLQKVKDICHENGALLILDEMATGFRLHLNGAQTMFNVKPDLSTFGKGMANGYPLAALVGRRDIMDLGGILNKGEEKVFLISTTHGSEMISLGAFIKTVEIFKRENIIDHFWSYGKKLMDGMNKISKDLGINDYFFLNGYPCTPYYFTFDENKEFSFKYRTLFLQEMIKNKVIMPQIALSLSHGDKELEFTLDAVKKSLKVYSQALEEGVDKFVKGEFVKPVFRKFI
jgi:glutamate-1-semialdehyde 2,1-aminomutase